MALYQAPNLTIVISILMINSYHIRVCYVIPMWHLLFLAQPSKGYMLLVWRFTIKMRGGGGWVDIQITFSLLEWSFNSPDIKNYKSLNKGGLTLHCWCKPWKIDEKKRWVNWDLLCHYPNCVSLTCVLPICGWLDLPWYVVRSVIVSGLLFSPILAESTCLEVC